MEKQEIKKTMEQHFNISGGKLLAKLRDGVEIMARTGVLVFKIGNFETTVTATENTGKFYRAEHYILYNNGDMLYAFNCNNQKSHGVCRNTYIIGHYVCNDEIYVQTHGNLTRISDCIKIDVPLNVNLIVKGNSRYTVIAYDEHSDQHGNGRTYQHINSIDKKNPVPVNKDHKLRYMIRNTHDLAMIGEDSITIDPPEDTRYTHITIQDFCKYLESLDKQVEVTDTHIKICGIKFEYKHVNTEECCVCFEKNNMTKLTCEHDVCVSCAPKVTSCPLCRAAITCETPQ